LKRIFGFLALALFLPLSAHATEMVIQRDSSNIATKMDGANLLSWSPDGNFLACGWFLHVWDLQIAALLKPINPPREDMLQLRWINNHVLHADYMSAANNWKINRADAKIERIREFTPYPPTPENGSLKFHNGVLLSPNQKYFLSHDSHQEGKICLWNAATVKLLKTMNVYVSNDYATFHQTFWLPDSTHFIQTAHRQIELWNAETGRRERIFTKPLQPSLQAETTSGLLLRAISPEGKYLAATAQDNEKVSKIFVFEIGSGKLLRTIVTTTIHDVGFSSNGALLAIGITWPKSHTEIWNWRIDEKPRTIIPDVAVYDSLDGAWSPDNSRIAIGTENYIAIYKATTGELLTTMATQTANDAKEFALNPPDWLIWTPQGYFSAPDHGHKRVRWEENGKMIPLDSPRDKALRAKFYNPKMVAESIAGAS